MQKRTGLTFLLVCLLLIVPFFSASYATQGTATLYMHKEQLPCYMAEDYWFTRWMKIVPCCHEEYPEELMSENMEPLEPAIVRFYDINYSYTEFYFQFIALSPFITSLSPSTWTFHFLCLAEFNDTVTIIVDTIEIWDNASICPPPERNGGPVSAPLNGKNIQLLASPSAKLVVDDGAEPKWYTEDVPETDFIFEVMVEVDVNWDFPETVEVVPSDWLVIGLSANFTIPEPPDTGSSFAVLLIDEGICCEEGCTKITGIDYEIRPSAYWNPAVRMIWQILLPLMFVIGASLTFISYKKGKLDIEDAVVLCIAFLALAVLAPVGLNILYGA